MITETLNKPKKKIIDLIHPHDEKLTLEEYETIKSKVIWTNQSGRS